VHSRHVSVAACYARASVVGSIANPILISSIAAATAAAAAAAEVKKRLSQRGK